MQLAIFTHVEHTEREGLYYAYPPYVREMNLWLKHVEEVEIVGTTRQEDLETRRPGSKKIFYKHGNLTFTAIPSINFLTFASAVKAVIKLPNIFFKIFWAMRRADHLHLRCPGNVGLLACIAQIFFPSKQKTAKYAGNWDPQAKQPWTYKLQKWILSNTFFTRNMKVLAYGEWSEQSKNIVPFFTASFSEVERAEVLEKEFCGTFSFLFVGNLVAGKQPLKAVKLVEALNASTVKDRDQEIFSSLPRAHLGIFGNGPERQKLKKYIRENNLEEMVLFHGSRHLEEIKAAYQKAHFVILPSRSEGWPKAIAEGMYFGCIPISTPVSCVPWMLDYGERGILLSNICSEQWSDDIHRIITLMYNPKEMKQISANAKEWSQKYTLEKFEEAIKKILLDRKK